VPPPDSGNCRSGRLRRAPLSLGYGAAAAAARAPPRVVKMVTARIRRGGIATPDLGGSGRVHVNKFMPTRRTPDTLYTVSVSR